MRTAVWDPPGLGSALSLGSSWFCVGHCILTSLSNWEAVGMMPQVLALALGREGWIADGLEHVFLKDGLKSE